MFIKTAGGGLVNLQHVSSISVLRIDTAKELYALVAHEPGTDYLRYTICEGSSEVCDGVLERLEEKLGVYVCY